LVKAKRDCRGRRAEICRGSSSTEWRLESAGKGERTRLRKTRGWGIVRKGRRVPTEGPKGHRAERKETNRRGGTSQVTLPLGQKTSSRKRGRRTLRREAGRQQNERASGKGDRTPLQDDQAPNNQHQKWIFPEVKRPTARWQEKPEA